MKRRATSALLAALAAASLITPALAMPSAPLANIFLLGDGVAQIAEITEAEPALSPILLDAAPADTLEYEFLDGVCYVTVGSFVPMLDPEAMVEEEDGVVTVSASTPILVEDGSGDVQEGDAPEEPSDTANLVSADLELTAQAGESYFTANGRYLYAAGGLVLVNGRVAAPVRQLARVFNLTVEYDGQAEQILLAHQEGAEPYLASGDDTYDGDTLYWLSRIIFCESGNQPLDGKIAVGNVVMNRVNHPRFPDTIKDVIFQKNQFTPARSGSIYRDPNSQSVIAAKLVLDGAEVMPDALFFNAAGVRSYAARNKTYVTTIGNHAFYK